MAIEAIVFDFGGVLIDWNPRYLYKKIFQNEQEMEYFLSNVCTTEWNSSLDKGKPFKQGVAELIKIYPHYAQEIMVYDTRWEEMCGSVIQGSVDILRCVSRYYPVYGLTNWSAEKFEITFKKNDFFKIFKGIVISGVEKEKKPEPRIFNILIDRYNLNPKTTVFIDDSPANIETAKKLGFQTIHFQTPELLKQELLAKNVRLS